MQALMHKVFRGEPGVRFHWGLKGAYREFDRVREAAEGFANDLGAEKVVSVVEYLTPEFTVVIWYRDEVPGKPRPIAALADAF